MTQLTANFVCTISSSFSSPVPNIGGYSARHICVCTRGGRKRGKRFQARRLGGTYGCRRRRRRDVCSCNVTLQCTSYRHRSSVRLSDGQGLSMVRTVTVTICRPSLPLPFHQRSSCWAGKSLSPLLGV